MLLWIQRSTFFSASHNWDRSVGRSDTSSRGRGKLSLPLYPVLTQGKLKPLRRNTKRHIPLTRNSTVAGWALELSSLFVPVGSSLKTQAAVPKTSGTPLEKYRVVSRKHCSITCFVRVLVTAPCSGLTDWKQWLTLENKVALPQGFYSEPSKGFDSRGFVVYTSSKKNDGRDGKNPGQGQRRDGNVT